MGVQIPTPSNSSYKIQSRDIFFLILLPFFLICMQFYFFVSPWCLSITYLIIVFLQVKRNKTIRYACNFIIHTNMCKREFIWQQEGVKILGSFMGSHRILHGLNGEGGTKSAPHFNATCYPPMVNNEHPLTYYSLFDSIKSQLYQ